MCMCICMSSSGGFGERKSAWPVCCGPMAMPRPTRPWRKAKRQLSATFSQLLFFVAHVACTFAGRFNPWSGMFSRASEELTSHLEPLLLPYRDLVRHHRPMSSLDIGCGLGRVMLEQLSAMADANKGSDDRLRSLCSTGMSFLNYTHYIYASANASEPPIETARRDGLGALFEEGPLDAQSVATVRSRLRVPAPELPDLVLPAPVVVDADYNLGLPFAPGTFDTILEQGSIKWSEPRMLPDRERHVEDYGRFFFDEVLRVLRTGGFALLELGKKATWPTFMKTPWPPSMHWCRSSATLGSNRKADVLFSEHKDKWSWPQGLGPRPLPRRQAEQLWSLLKRQVVPLEVAVGSVTLRHAMTDKGGGLASAPDCSPATCSQQPACGLREKAPQAAPSFRDKHARGTEHACGLSLLFATPIESLLYVQKFAPAASATAGATDGGDAPSSFGARCASAARALPVLHSLLEQGRFVPEPQTESQTIAGTLRARGNHGHLGWLRFAGRGGLNTHLYDELAAASVRLWYREHKPCHGAAVPADSHVGGAAKNSTHLMRESGCGPGAPRITWSNLHTLVIDEPGPRRQQS